MCGHGTIGVATVLVETGMVPVIEPVTTVRLDTPAGLVVADVRGRGRRGHGGDARNVPSFAAGPGRKRRRARLRRGRATTWPSAATSTPSWTWTQLGLPFDRGRKNEHARRRSGHHAARSTPPTGRCTPRTPDINGCHHVYLAAPGSDAAPLPARHGHPPGLVRPLAVRHRHQRPDGPAARPRRAAAGTGTSSTSPSSAPASSAGSSRRPRSAACRAVVPTVTGRAWITGTAQYLLDPTDPFPAGFQF